MEEVTEETTLETLSFYAKKIIQYKHHFIFLTACREMNVIPHGLRIKKTACIQTVSEDFDTHWDSILHQSEIQLLLHLQEECCVIVRKWHSGFYDVLLQSDVDEMELLNLMSTLSETISKEETDLFIRRIHKLSKFTNRTTEQISPYVWDNLQFGNELKQFAKRIMNIIYQTIAPIVYNEVQMADAAENIPLATCGNEVREVNRTLPDITTDELNHIKDGYTYYDVEEEGSASSETLVDMGDNTFSELDIPHHLLQGEEEQFAEQTVVELRSNTSSTNSFLNDTQDQEMVNVIISLDETLGVNNNQDQEQLNLLVSPEETTANMTTNLEEHVDFTVTRGESTTAQADMSEEQGNADPTHEREERQQQHTVNESMQQQQEQQEHQQLPQQQQQEPERLEGKFVSENVFNLSKRELTEIELKLLSKGLTFIPTPEKFDKHQLKLDVEEFGRQVKLKLFFKDDENDFSQTPAFRAPSTWTPAINEVELEVYLSILEDELLQIEERGKNFSNLTLEEREALKALVNDEGIVIKPADKGSAIVVWDREDYEKEAQRQLYDEKIYEKVNRDPIPEVNKKIDGVLNHMVRSKQIDKKIRQFLQLHKPQLGTMYLLPKIHKSVKSVKGRPVISNCSTATENISAYLDSHLDPLIKKIPSVLEDSREFLEKLSGLGQLPENAILVTFDVVGLYSNIPHEEGLEALRVYLEQREDKSVSTQSLLDLARIVLENNYFGFGDETFHQILGTAMGTKFAPKYANMFMGQFEERLLESLPHKPHTWWRFLDDIFCIWTGTQEQLHEMYEIMNNFHPTIKFTMDIMEGNKIPFLDVLVKLEDDNNISTDVYYKPTDTHQYLMTTSCHPEHVKKSIFYSQGLRLRRIVSKEEQSKERVKELKGWMEKRGYKGQTLDGDVGRIQEKRRCELLRKVPKTRTFGPPRLVLTFHPAISSSVFPILKRIQRFLVKSPKLARLFNYEPPRITWRNAKSLKEHLVHSKLDRRGREENPGNFGCGAPLCEICPESGNLLVGTNTFHSSVSDKVYRMNNRFNCNSKYVVYLITCKTCGKQYVGSTTTKFRQRHNNYKSLFKKYGEGIRGMNQESLYEHFYGANHTGCFDQVDFQIIDYCDPNDQERRESFWVFHLKPELNDAKVIVKKRRRKKI